MIDVNASPVPALIKMFIWDKFFIKHYSDGTPCKYYFLRKDGNKLHTVYSHPEQHRKLVYYVKDCGDNQAASDLFLAKQKKRLENNYSSLADNITIQEAVNGPFSFFTA
ncbi:hypothetical protein [Alteromonas gracilis]|uniref:hypothetical protein n=1 Tax=Alteromonas gracilis TaxID=1479524 RepID=UPI003736E398